MQAAGRPKLAVRKSDCSAVLRTVIEDAVTVTVDNYQTLVSITVTITVVDRATLSGTTTTTRNVPRQVGEMTALPEALLDARDKVRPRCP